MKHSGDNTSNLLYFKHWAILAGGFLAGLAAVVIVDSIPFDFSHELAEARQHGIVSLTILNGYPKSRDILFYAALILLPVSFSLGAWLLWSRNHRPALESLFRQELTGSPAAPGSRKLAVLTVVLAILTVTFNLNFFYEPSSGWAFVGEAGEYLAWANILLDGGTYARDFFCLYGPLMIYPLAWTMKAFGASIVVYRVYGYVLELIAYAILIAFFHLTIRRRWLFMFASLFCLLISANLRFALGIVPMLILFRYPGTGRRLPAALSGFVLGLSLLFSQEAGLCAAIALAVFLFLEARSAGDYRHLARLSGLVVMGCLVVLAPVLTYFYQQNALGRFFESVYGYPKLIMLGYAALPFPHFTDLFAAPLSNGAYLPYWIIGVYLAAALSLSVFLFLGRGNRDLNLKAAILVYGLFLFRTALGRSDMSHFVNSSLPAFLLVFLMLDDLAGGVLNRSQTSLRNTRIAATAALILSMMLLVGSTRTFRNNLLSMPAELTHLTSKFTVQESGVSLPQLTRGGVHFDPTTAETMMKIRNALDRRTKPGDHVFFFPNEAAYYFLFDRRSPTRFVHAYFAVTTDQRLEMVADLERNRPAYVVYSLADWRIDTVPEAIQVPEVVAYLRARYTPDEYLGDILILRRKGI